MWPTIELAPTRPDDLAPTLQARISQIDIDLLLDQHTVCRWHTLMSSASLIRLRGYRVLMPFSPDTLSGWVAPYLYLENRASHFCTLLHDTIADRSFLLRCILIQDAKLFIPVFLHQLRIPEAQAHLWNAQGRR